MPFCDKAKSKVNPKPLKYLQNPTGKYLGLLFLFLALPALINAQVKMEIVCNAFAEEEDTGCMIVSGWKESGFSDSAAMERYLRDLVAHLHGKGWLAASVDSMVRLNGQVSAYLHTGRQYGRVLLSLENIDGRIVRKIGVRPGRVEGRALPVEDFRSLQSRILNHYENSGYPFALTGLDSPGITGDTIKGSLIIDKNRFYTVDSIHIYGNPPSEPSHLYRHIGIVPGDPYSESRFRETGQVIRNTPFLTEIRAPEMEFRKETASLYLYIDRRQASHFSGILGILPGAGGEAARLVGELDLSLINVFRRMENITLQWQSPGNQVQQADLAVGQPYLFGSSFGADISLHMYRADSTYIKIEAEAGIPFTIPGRGTFRVFGKTLGTTLIVSGGGAGDAAFPASGLRGRVFGISYRHSRLDNRINPYRGWQVSTSLGAGNRAVTPVSDYHYADGSINKGFGEGMIYLQGFLPLTSSTTIVLSSLSGKKMNLGVKREDDHFFVNEMFLLGGLQSIRGFDERSLAASSYIIQRVEYRYLFDAPGNIFIFFDGMAYRRKLPDAVTSDTPFGFGGGLAFETRAGQLTISYALGKQLNNPLTLRSGRIHIGIINRF